MLSTFNNASSALSLHRSLGLVSGVSCMENITHLALFHNSFWDKQVSGLVSPHNGMAACCLKADSPHFHHLSYIHKLVILPVCTLMQICKHAHMHIYLCKHYKHISPSCPVGNILPSSPVIPTDNHILITWAPVA